ncbi:zinc finger protein 317-like [Pollicipes pollicipes]|uniref:zinc finger protein 317-like n=1 Tax=Pollicipes pollicipes TaxID=41117 RepID=UPI0018850762|nr:zinc finger protein 317-like [Pollicipes pollicipes]
MKSFRLHPGTTIRRGSDIEQYCLRDGPGVEPAFPETNKEVIFLKGMMKGSSRFFYIGIVEASGTDGVYNNVRRNRPITLKPEWFNSKQTANGPCKAFNHKWVLKDHSRTHTGEKPSCCKLSGRAFIKTALVCNARILTRERPFRCELCDKAFMYRCSLREHA